MTLSRTFGYAGSWGREKGKRERPPDGPGQGEGGAEDVHARGETVSDDVQGGHDYNGRRGRQKLGQWTGEEASLCAREQEDRFIPETNPDQGQATATGPPRCQWYLDRSS